MYVVFFLAILNCNQYIKKGYPTVWLDVYLIVKREMDVNVVDLIANKLIGEYYCAQK